MKKTPLVFRFLPSSRLLALCLAVCLAGASPVFAQTTIEVRSPILVIDQDRLFSETRLGSNSRETLEQAANDLKDENQKIEEALITEERALTEQRASLQPEAFRILADEFDVRVQRIRVEQDEKARALTRAQEDARNNFFQDVAATISDIVRERGALVVIDRRNVFLSAGQIDITDEAIARVNAAESGEAD